MKLYTNYFFKGGVDISKGELTNGSLRFALPRSSGTLALTSQIPTNYVNLSGAQTISGVKSFSVYPVFSGTSGDPTSDKQFATKGYVDKMAPSGFHFKSPALTPVGGVCTWTQVVDALYTGVPFIQVVDNNGSIVQADINFNTATSTVTVKIYSADSVPANKYVLHVAGKGALSTDQITDLIVDTVSDQDIAGKKTFTVTPVIPLLAPTENTQVANKAYVDSVGSGSVELANAYADGQFISKTTTSAQTIKGALTISGASTLNSTLKVTGTTTLNGTLSATKAATMSSTLAVTGATTLKSTLAVTGATTATGGIKTNSIAGIANTANILTVTSTGSTLDATTIKENGVLLSDKYALGTEVVKISGNQSVEGLKTFATLPQYSGTNDPSDDKDFATKAYVDKIAPSGFHFKSPQLTPVDGIATWTQVVDAPYVGVPFIQVVDSDGAIVQADIKFNVAASTAIIKIYTDSIIPANKYILHVAGKGALSTDQITDLIVDTFSDQDIAGTKTFTVTPVIPANAPTIDTQVANKAYVDSVGTNSVASAKTYADGEFISKNSTAAQTVKGALTTTGASTLNGTLKVAGTTTLNGTLSATKAATFSNTVSVTGATTLKSTLAVTGATTSTGGIKTNSIAGIANTANILTVTSAGSTLNATTIQENGTNLTDKYALKTEIPDISGKADSATTLSGYGITDALSTTATAIQNVAGEVKFNGGLRADSFKTLYGTSLFTTISALGFDFTGIYRIYPYKSSTPFFESTVAGGTSTLLRAHKIYENGVLLSDKYALGADVVKISGGQSIEGLKTFATLPQYSGTNDPSNDKDFATKAYVDKIAPSGFHFKCPQLTPVDGVATWTQVVDAPYVGVPFIQVVDSDGAIVHADIKFNVATSTATIKIYTDSTIPANKYVLHVAGKGALSTDQITDLIVDTFSDQDIAGTKTFTVIPVIPASAPTIDTQVTNKAYVDSIGANSVANAKTYADGEFISKNSTAAQTIKGALTTTGASTLNSTLKVAGTTTLNGTLSATKASTFSNTVSVNGATTLKSTVAITGVTTATGGIKTNTISGIANTATILSVTSSGSTLSVTEVKENGTSLASKYAPIASVVYTTSVTNPSLTLSNGSASWSISLASATELYSVLMMNISSGRVVMPDYTWSAANKTLTVTIDSSETIAAGVYKVNISYK